MMTKLEKMKRLSATFAALAVTVGVIFLMRLLVHEIVFRGGLVTGEGVYAEEPPPLEYMPRKWDLGRLIPPELVNNIGGMPTLETFTRENAPADVVRERIAAEAEAEGLVKVELPLSVALTMPSLLGSDTYIRPDGEYRTVSVTEGKVAGTSYVTENRLPLSELAVPFAADGNPLEEAAMRCGPEMKRLLPSVIAELVDGYPIETRLIERNGGHGFHIIWYSPYPPKEAMNRFAANAAAKGWQVSVGYDGSQTPAPFRLLKDNLSVFCGFTPHSDGRSVAMARIADDENLISNKGILQ